MQVQLLLTLLMLVALQTKQLEDFLVNMTNNFSNTSYAVNYTVNAYAGESFPANVTCVAKFEYYSGGFETGAYDVVCYGGSALVDGKYNYTVLMET